MLPLFAVLLLAVPAPVGRLSTYLVVPSCRFLDTRQEIAVAPRGPIESFRALRLQGSCGVPLGARVAILNVTVTSSSSGGDLGLCSSEQTAFPDGRPLACPPTVYFAAGQTRAAMAMVQLYGVHEDDPEESDLLAVATLPAGSVHLIVDVIGYLR